MIQKNLLFLLLFFCSVGVAAAGPTADEGVGLKSNSFKELVKKEELPLAVQHRPAQSQALSGNLGRVGLALGLVLCLMGVAFIVWRMLRLNKHKESSRKYLVEKMSYVNLGPKTGAWVLKVGSEFVMVGVTSQQVSFLTKLPELQKEYQEETKFEKGTFKEAVEEEFNRIKSNSTLNV